MVTDSVRESVEIANEYLSKVFNSEVDFYRIEGDKVLTKYDDGVVFGIAMKSERYSVEVLRGKKPKQEKHRELHKALYNLRLELAKWD